MKKVFIAISAVIFVGFLVAPKPVYATFDFNLCQYIPQLCNHSTPTPSPSATPTVSPTPSESPTPTEVPCEVECEPTPTPEATPSATPEVRVFSEPEPARAPVCVDVAPSKVPNIFVEQTGNKGELRVKWIPTGGTKAHIFYGLEVGRPEHSLINTDNDGTEVIRNLASGKHYWFSVTNGDGCAWSDRSDWYDPIVL